MIKKIIIVLIILIACFFISFLGFVIYSKIQISHFEKKYMEKLLVSDYQGAITVAKEWGKNMPDRPNPFVALASAYALNFELRKAESIALNYIRFMSNHRSSFNNETIANGYAMLASFECAIGSYEEYRQSYRKVEELDSEFYKKTLSRRYICKMNELSENSNVDQVERNAFKKEIANYVLKTQIVEDKPSFNLAILAYRVAEDKTRALNLAKIAYTPAEELAEKKFGDRTKVLPYVKATMAMFYAINGDMISASELLGCIKGCDADSLLQRGNDPYWLARYFVAINDFKSAEICIRNLWSRMITDEQKEHFFRSIDAAGRKEDSPWKSLWDLDWVKKAYFAFKADKQTSN